MSNQTPPAPFELPATDLSGISYYDPYMLSPLLPPMDPNSMFASQVGLEYLKYFSSIMRTPPATSDPPCPPFDFNSYYMNLAHSQALCPSMIATSPPTVMEHSACPSSPAPTPIMLDSDMSPKLSLKSDSVSDYPLIPIQGNTSPSSVALKSVPRATKHSLPEDNLDSIDNAPHDEDPAARKRRQNTIAARKSRLRKMVRMEELEGTVAELQKDKIQLETRLAVLESEKLGAQQRANDAAARIRLLEAQLLEAYKSQRN